jgi:aspartyl-tRNA(Asn)/glutamyl-tRNA(Gln) amidotransferase subunit B
MDTPINTFLFFIICTPFTGYGFGNFQFVAMLKITNDCSEMIKSRLENYWILEGGALWYNHWHSDEIKDRHAMPYETVIGLEVHAELQTRSKMFCACPVVDSTRAEPNTAVCPVCAGMPGTLPVVNRKAVELALRVALALECEIAPLSLFARKNYFYPDLPKGYQISQYEYPLAQHGVLRIEASSGEKAVRIRRVHLEEDTGKLIHMQDPDGHSFSLVDLNRAGVPLLEIVSEPDMHSLEEVRAYATTLRAILSYF